MTEPPPRPSRWRPLAGRLVVAAFLLAVAAVAIPASPFYLPKLLIPPLQHHGRSLNSWMGQLDSADDQAKQDALFAIGAIGPGAEAAVPRLAVILTDDPVSKTRNEAALALTKMTPASAGAIDALSRAMDDPDDFVRMNVALALRRLGKDALPAVPNLLRALDDDRNNTNLGVFHQTIQHIVVLALSRATAGTGDAVGPVTTALGKNDTHEMRRVVAQALGEIGPPAREAIPLLQKMAAEKEPLIREFAEEAIAKIKEQDVAPVKKEDDATAKLELPEAERAYIWDIEHHGNLLNKHGFAALAAALSKADRAALARLLAPDFQGGDLATPTRVHTKTSALDIERLEGGPATPLPRDAAIARLLELRGLFRDKPPQVKLSLITLSPTVRGQVAGEWQGTALLRLVGEATPGAPAEVMATVAYKLDPPTKERLAKDGWLRSLTIQQLQTARATSPLFVESAARRGLDPGLVHDNWTTGSFVPTPGGVFVCDFDRDGILDVLIADIQTTTLFKGKGDGTFTDVTAACGLKRESVVPPHATWADLDGDGYPDLILGLRFYKNDGGTRFIDVTDRCNIRLPSSAGNVVVADYDRDGRLDLYVTRVSPPGGTSWLDQTTSDRLGNLLYRNKGGWQFENVTRAARASGGSRSTFTAVWLDANNDGWPDLHVPNEFGDGVLLVNQRDGTFKEQPLADRPADFGTMGAAAGDLDNDGNIDLYCANMYSKAGTRVMGNMKPDAYPPAVMEQLRRFVAGSQLHLNKGGGKFEQAGTQMQVAAVGWAYGPCLADFDNDGFLDIYATAGYVSRSRTEPDG